MNFPSGFFVALLLGLGTVNCGPDAERFPAPDAAVDVPPPVDADPRALELPLHCDLSLLRVVRLDPWPGGGVQVLFTTDDPSQLAAGSPQGDLWPATLSPVPLDAPGVTGLALVLSPDLAVMESRKARAQQFISALPAHEKVALWQVGNERQLLADVTGDRSHVLARLAAIESAPGQPGTAWQLSVREQLAELGDRFGLVHRKLVIVGQPPIAQSVGVLRSVETCWLDDAGERCTGPLGPSEIAGHTYRLGVCPPLAASILRFQVGGARCDLPLPSPAMEPLFACDPGLAAIDHFPWGLELNVVLNVEEKALYDQFYAEKSQEEFNALVSLGARSPTPGTLHFRGATSMNCARKSLKVNLKGNHARRLVPGGSGDEFILISLCKDERYFNQVFANRLLHHLGQFPLGGRYVRLRVNDVNLGAYYLLSHAKETLVSRHLDLRALVRRRFDPHDKPEDVKVPDDPAGIAMAQAAYDELAAVALFAPPESLSQQLDALMDVDRYLRWLAFNTFVRNGDTIDEAMFFASMEKGTLFFRHMGWDADDLFSACHHYSKYALEDPYGLIYCAEGNLDHALLRSPALYARYVDHLEALLLHALPDELLAATMLQLRDELFAVINDDATASAMVVLNAANPDAATAQGAREDIWAHMQEMLAEAKSSRALLLDAIAVYRTTQ